jgi:HK97 gp10 family phage protein
VQDTSIRVEGLNQLLRKLEALDAEAKADFKAATAKAGQPVLAESKRQVPSVSGTLASSIRLRASRREVVIAAGGKRAPYAAVVHFGWGRRNRPATPYFYRAIALTKDEVLHTFESAVMDVWNRNN